MEIILASKSPRRKEIFGKLAERIGFDFKIVTEEVDESLGGIHPERGVEILAVRKGAAVLAGLPEALVVSSDTLVELDGDPLGKPCDETEAKRMLRSLSDRWHNVHTGIAVHYNGRVISGVATTRVRFCDLSDEQIDAYVSSGEPMDKAGAYGIQGKAGEFVAEYDGEFDTVVGFNVTLLQKLLAEAVGDIGCLGDEK